MEESGSNCTKSRAMMMDVHELKKMPKKHLTADPIVLATWKKYQNTFTMI